MEFPAWLKVYGDTSRRGPCPSELDEHRTFVNQCRQRWPDTVGRIMVHPRNEAKRTPRQIQIEKIEGLVTGSADFIFPGNPCLVIELKRLNHCRSRWGAGQLEYLRACKDVGAMVCVALGYEAAMKAVQEWIQRKNVLLIAPSLS